MPEIWRVHAFRRIVVKHSTLIDDLCVGFDGPAIWGAQKDPPWVLALVAPTPAMTKFVTQDAKEAAVLGDMTVIAADKGLQPHEVPLRVRLVPEKFTIENGMRNANFVSQSMRLPCLPHCTMMFEKC